MQRTTRIVMVAAAVGALVGCGSDSDSGLGGLADDTGGGDLTIPDDATEAINDALGAGGGGTLVFDGEEIAIDSALCVLDDETFDVGTVSANDVRVFVTKNRPDSDVSAQILDGDFVQWFPQDVTGDEAVRDGGTFTQGPTPYFNNQDDRIVEASFTIQCP